MLSFFKFKFKFENELSEFVQNEFLPKLVYTCVEFPIIIVFTCIFLNILQIVALLADALTEIQEQVLDGEDEVG